MKVVVFSITLMSNLLNTLISSISKCKALEVLKLSARLFITLFSISSIF